MKVVKKFEEVRSKQSFSGLECVFKRKDGEHIILETSGRPFFGEKGNIRGFRGVSRDITARKRIEEKTGRKGSEDGDLVEISKVRLGILLGKMSITGKMNLLTKMNLLGKMTTTGKMNLY